VHIQAASPCCSCAGELASGRTYSMSNTTYYLFALFLAGVLVWQLISGTALGTWWRPRITRQDNPGTYWFVLAAQSVILIAFLITGRAWHLR